MAGRAGGARMAGLTSRDPAAAEQLPWPPQPPGLRATPAIAATGATTADRVTVRARATPTCLRAGPRHWSWPSGPTPSCSSSRSWSAFAVGSLALLPPTRCTTPRTWWRWSSPSIGQVLMSPAAHQAPDLRLRPGRGPRRPPQLRGAAGHHRVGRDRGGGPLRRRPRDTRLGPMLVVGALGIAVNGRECLATSGPQRQLPQHAGRPSGTWPATPSDRLGVVDRGRGASPPSTPTWADPLASILISLLVVWAVAGGVARVRGGAARGCALGGWTPEQVSRGAGGDAGHHPACTTCTCGRSTPRPRRSPPTCSSDHETDLHAGPSSSPTPPAPSCSSRFGIVAHTTFQTECGEVP